MSINDPYASVAAADGHDVVARDFIHEAIARGDRTRNRLFSLALVLTSVGIGAAAWLTYRAGGEQTISREVQANVRKMAEDSRQTRAELATIGDEVVSVKRTVDGRMQDAIATTSRLTSLEQLANRTARATAANGASVANMQAAVAASRPDVALLEEALSAVKTDTAALRQLSAKSEAQYLSASEVNRANIDRVSALLDSIETRLAAIETEMKGTDRFRLRSYAAKENAVTELLDIGLQVRLGRVVDRSVEIDVLKDSGKSLLPKGPRTVPLREAPTSIDFMDGAVEYRLSISYLLRRRFARDYLGLTIGVKPPR